MKNYRYFIQKYLENRPSFYAYIRPQEAFLFYERIHKMKGPILDFGCGDGFFASTIFKKRFIDIGLDLPSSRIKESIPTYMYKKLQVYDGTTIPFKSGTFRTIISNCVFEHVPNIKKSVTEMCRVTKKNGYLMTTVMCSPWSDNLCGGKLFGKAYIHLFNRIQHHDSLFSKKEWTTLFKKSGYEIVEAIDYLYELSSQKTELHHYSSIFSLITYTFFKRWNIGRKNLTQTTKKIEKLILEDTMKPSACFFVLKKI